MARPLEYGHRGREDPGPSPLTAGAGCCGLPNQGDRGLGEWIQSPAAARSGIAHWAVNMLIHFGKHCQKLRQRVKPRIAQLRKLAGHDWELRETQLRTVVSGYMRSARDMRLRLRCQWRQTPASSSLTVNYVRRLGKSPAARPRLRPMR